MRLIKETKLNVENVWQTIQVIRMILTTAAMSLQIVKIPARSMPMPRALMQRRRFLDCQNCCTIAARGYVFQMGRVSPNVSWVAICLT